MQKFKITFLPDNLTVEIEKDKTLFSAAISAGIYINAVCGGDGVCGRCKVILKSGVVTVRASSVLSEEEKKSNIYLACLTAAQSDLVVEVPETSRLHFSHPNERSIYSSVEDFIPQKTKEIKSLFKHFPLVGKIYLELPRPDLNDSAGDLERIYRELEKAGYPKVQAGLFNIRQLSEILRDAEWKITFTLGKRENVVEILMIEPDDTTALNYGLCFDIGTTTISGQLVDLGNQKVLGSKSTYNRQSVFGSDVITRIIHAASKTGLEQLHNAVTQTMNEIIFELVSTHKIDLNNLNCVVCAGNTTMIHLLLGIDPTYIRRDPYIPAANFLPVVRAAEVSVNINPRGLLFCIPGVASYVGSDTTAGALSSRIYSSDDLCLLIDIGTNGEIVLGSKEFMVSCSASAGPAFEGSGVSNGMRASAGAIQDVIIRQDFELTYATIGECKPRGICGTGYISLLAGMLDTGVIDKSGKIQLSGRRVRLGENGKEFIVAFKEETENLQDIVITEADIENLKRSKGAIYSACAVLVRHLGLSFNDLAKIYIAGGFGTSLDIDRAVRIGLLPDLARDKFVFIGNSSLAGAKEVLLSAQALAEAFSIAKKITYFELSVDSGYMDEYSQSLFFPHTDLTRFPSVRK